MPNLEIVEKIQKERERLAIEIAEEGMYLTTNEILQVAVGINQSDETVRRYMRGEVKKIATAKLMLDEMRRVRANRNA